MTTTDMTNIIRSLDPIAAHIFRFGYTTSARMGDLRALPAGALALYIYDDTLTITWRGCKEGFLTSGQEWKKTAIHIDALNAQTYAYIRERMQAGDGVPLFPPAAIMALERTMKGHGFSNHSIKRTSLTMLASMIAYQGSWTALRIQARHSNEYQTKAYVDAPNDPDLHHTIHNSKRLSMSPNM